MRTLVAALTVLVLLTMPGESSYSDPVFWLVDIVKSCRHSIVPYDQAKRDDVVNWCVNLVVQMKASGAERGCFAFYSWEDDSGTLAMDDEAFYIAARLVFNKTCLGPTTFPPATTTPEPAPTHNARTCGKSDALLGGTVRIVGGTTVRDCSVIPWQVKLDVGPYKCGGSIISDRHILTAAHCVAWLDVSEVFVTLAEHDLDKNDTYEERRPLKNVTWHKDYNDVTVKNDVAVLTLKDPIQFNNPCVAKVCRNPSFDFDGRRCTTSGWGRIAEGGVGISVLQMVKVKTHKGENCQKEFNIQKPGYVHDTQQMICAGDVKGGKDSCQGDSGGPLFCLDYGTNSFVQVGIVSYGIGCAREGNPGVYTNVAYYHDWIETVMKENSD